MTVEQEMDDLLMDKFECAKKERELARQVDELRARQIELQTRIVEVQAREGTGAGESASA